MDIKIDISIIRNPSVQFSSSTLDKSQSSILFEAGNDLNSEALDDVTSSEAVVKLDVLVSAIFSSLEASESGNSSKHVNPQNRAKMTNLETQGSEFLKALGPDIVKRCQKI